MWPPRAGTTSSECPRRRPRTRQHARVRRGKWAAGQEWERLRGSARNDVIRAEALVRAGVAESTVYARCRAGGPWQRLLPATILLSNGRPTPDQLVIAGLLYAGPDAVVTGLHAARRHGVRRGPEPGGRLHLLVPHGRRPAGARYVDIERTHRMPSAVLRSGVPLAPVQRAVVDGARRLDSPREITELIADAVQRGLCTVSELGSEVEAAQRRGTALPRAVLRDVSIEVRAVGRGRRSGSAHAGSPPHPRCRRGSPGAARHLPPCGEPPTALGPGRPRTGPHRGGGTFLRLSRSNVPPLRSGAGAGGRGARAGVAPTPRPPVAAPARRTARGPAGRRSAPGGTPSPAPGPAAPRRPAPPPRRCPSPPP